MQQAERVADFTAVMYLGELVEYGETAQVLKMPKTKLPEITLTAHSVKICKILIVKVTIVAPQLPESSLAVLKDLTNGVFRGLCAPFRVARRCLCRE